MRKRVLAELETTTDVVFPEGLAEIVARVLREGPASARGV